ncbi:TPA: hypothetical protein NKA85_003891 [Vibrio parahaemolyticus]|nr:hypothetical protein [Vibrio parahaemolyticus]
MKFRNQFFKYMTPASDGTEGGSGSGAPSEGGQEQTQQPKKEQSAGESDFDPEALKAENAKLLKESMKRKSKIQDLEDSLSKFEGVDLELYQTMLQERAEAEQARKKAEEEQLRKDGEFEKLLEQKSQEHESILEQMRNQHTTELEAANKKTSDLEEANKTLLGRIEELTVGAAFGNSQFIREDLISAMTPARVRALYGDHFEPNENGEVIGYDKPKGAEGRAPIVDSQGKAVSFDEALKTILEKQGDIESMLRNKVTGSGSSTTPGNGKSDGGRDIGTGVNRIAHALNKSG